MNGIKYFSALLAGVVTILIHFSAFAAEDHKIEFVDSMWDGKTIPDGQQCSDKGGKNSHTPKLKITNLPAGTKYLLMEITDEDNGRHHGTFRLEVSSNESEVIFPRIYENADEFPNGVTLVSGAPSLKDHYRPPCSGGKYHNYYSDIDAYGEGDKKLGSNRIDWGRY